MYKLTYTDGYYNDYDVVFDNIADASDRFDELVDNGVAVSMSLYDSYGEEIRGFNEGAHYNPLDDDDDDFDCEEDFDYEDYDDFDDEIGYDPYAGAYDEDL